VEAWGGGKDFDRDAYSSGPLLFPDPNVETQGPVVFQVTFVDAGNVSGARPLPSLKTAVLVELDRIGKRVDEEEWEVPSVYVLMTNVPVSACGRHDLEGLRRSTCVGEDHLTGRCGVEVEQGDHGEGDLAHGQHDEGCQGPGWKRRQVGAHRKPHPDSGAAGWAFRVSRAVLLVGLCHSPDRGRCGS
jgi:hypothetical protein